MITELKANTTYKLVDIEGWFLSDETNSGLYLSYFDEDGTITLTSASLNRGYVKGLCLIFEDELQFFEEVILPPVEAQEAKPEPVVGIPKNVPEEVKPLTRIVYRKTALSTKELLTEMLVNGKVYYSEDGKEWYQYHEEDGEFICSNLKTYVTTKVGNLHKWTHERVEEEISWQEQLGEEFDTSYSDKDDTFMLHSGLSTKETIKLAKRIIELSGTILL